MVVFVCSPYGGKQANIDRAINYCLMEIELGNTPYAPHIFFPQFMDEETERWEAIQMGLEMLDACAELHVWSNEITEGMKAEIEHAEENGIPVVYMEGA
ncbi:MAG TPA: DUF4406 domain-containing protein [Clostridia bacterium]|nr:DUF4406 domain-containing protein [Clostridia bacterium]